MNTFAIQTHTYMYIVHCIWTKLPFLHFTQSVPFSDHTNIRWIHLQIRPILICTLYTKWNCLSFILHSQCLLQITKILNEYICYTDPYLYVHCTLYINQIAFSSFNSVKFLSQFTKLTHLVYRPIFALSEPVQINENSLRTCLLNGGLGVDTFC